MPDLIHDANLSIRLMRDDLADYQIMSRWLSDPRVLEFYDGTRSVSLLLRYLFETKRARKVLLDPHSTNVRAFRCYEKCGFRKVKLLPAHELHEGTLRDSWLMEATPAP